MDRRETEYIDQLQRTRLYEFLCFAAEVFGRLDIEPASDLL